jgi:hypothetical protein
VVNLEKHIVKLNNTGAPNACNVFYTIAGTGAAMSNRLQVFYTAIRGKLLSLQTITIVNSGDTVDVATGAITGSWVGGTDLTVSGLTSSAYASGVGACVIWNTGVPVGRRRLRGKTFLVPLTAAFDVDGTIDATSLNTLVTASNTLATSSGSTFVVWHRPVNNLGGQAFPVVSATIKDTPAILTSRRVP